jgi:hypothetical protein
MPNFRREEKTTLGTDLSQMRRGDLGLTDSQKRAMMSRAQGGAAAQVGGLQGNIARRSMGTGGQFGGQAGAQQRQLATAVAKAPAEAAQQADQLSMQLGEARRQEILGRLAREGDIRRDNVGKVLSAGGAAVGAALGGPLGGAAGQLAGGALGALTNRIIGSRLAKRAGEATEAPGVLEPTALDEEAARIQMEIAGEELVTPSAPLDFSTVE